MRKISVGQKRLVADFLANIGVAWFAAGVIGIFISGTKNFLEIVVSISWGFALSLLFVLVAFYFMKGIDS